MTTTADATRRTRRTDPGRRDRIVDACLDVIADVGVAGASHRRIAARADVPLGSMSYHFAGMDELLREAFTRFADGVADTFERISIYHRGTEPEQTRSWKGTIDLVLVAKRGSARILHVDRQTGEWRGGEEILALPDSPLP